MAIDLPKTDLTRVQRWCQQRIPERAQHQVRLEHEVGGHDVILVQRRVPWDTPDTPFGPQWTPRPLARLRYSLAVVIADSDGRADRLAAAGIVLGQHGRGAPVVIIRGVTYQTSDNGVASMLRR